MHHLVMFTPHCCVFGAFRLFFFNAYFGFVVFAVIALTFFLFF